MLPFAFSLPMTNRLKAMLSLVRSLKATAITISRLYNVIAYPVVLPDIAYGVAFQQLHILVNGTDCPTYVTAEHIERIGHLLLRHPNGERSE